MKLTIIRPWMNRPGGRGGGGGSAGGGYRSTESGPPPKIINTREVVTVAGTPAEPPSVNLPTSQTGIMVPYIIGRQRIFSPNTIWYGNLQPRLETTREVQSVETEEIRTYDFGVTREFITVETIVETTSIVGYTIDMQMGLCLGPDVRCRGVYLRNVPIWSGNVGPARTVIDLPEGGAAIGNTNYLYGDIVFAGGEFNQPADTYIDDFQSDLPGYVGIAYAVMFGVECTTGFGEVGFELDRFPNPLGLDADVNRQGHDINVATAMYDFITNEWGGVGMNAGKLDTSSFEAAAIQLASEGNFCSLFIQQETTSAQVLNILKDQARAIIFTNPATGLITCRLIRVDNYDIETLPIFDESNVTSVRQMAKGTWNGAISQMRGLYTKRDGNYSQAPVIAQNLAVLSSGSRAKKTNTKEYPAAYTSAVARKLLARDLAGLGAPLLSLEIQTNRDGAQLLPGDGIRLSWGKYALDKYPWIVTKRKDTPTDSNSVVLQCEQLLTPIDSIVFSGDDDSLFNPVDPRAYAPLDVEVFTAPYWIMKKAGFNNSPIYDITTCYPVILAKQYNSQQSSFDAYISNTPNGDARAFFGSTYATKGNLVAAMGQFDAITTGIIATVLIKNVVQAQALINVGNSGVKNGRVFAKIGNELLSFESVTSIGAGIYQLNNVHRALIDTAPEAHSIDDEVWVFTNNYNFVSKTRHLIPSDYTPNWEFVGNSIRFAGDRADALFFSGWVPSDRPNNPNRPHNTKIDAAARSATETVINVGTDYDISWASRSRANIVSIPLQLDAAEAPEQTTDGAFQKHRIMIRDSLSVEWDCGVTTGSGDENGLTITAPAGMANGSGLLWVQAETSFGVSTFHDYLPITVTGGVDSSFVIVTEDGAFELQTEDGLHNIVTEG
jgi:hypothetical protein